MSQEPVVLTVPSYHFDPYLDIGYRVGTNTGYRQIVPIFISASCTSGNSQMAEVITGDSPSRESVYEVLHCSTIHTSGLDMFLVGEDIRAHDDCVGWVDFTLPVNSRGRSIQIYSSKFIASREYRS